MDEWTAIKYLTDYCSITIKTADKGSCVVVRDRNDYIVVAEKQLGDINICQDVNFSYKILRSLVDKINKIFGSLKTKVKLLAKRTQVLMNIRNMDIRKLLI